MRKTTYILLITIISSLIIIATAGRGQEISSSDHDIIITSGEDSYSIQETITLKSSTTEGIYEIIWPWIQSNADNIEIKINGETVASENVNDVGINISSLNIEMGTNPTLELTYILDKSIDTFQKMLQRDTDSITVSYDSIEIYSSTGLISDNSFTLSLDKVTQYQESTETVETIPNWAYIIIVVLIILLIISFVRPSKKQKTTTKKELIGGSEELLSTKKALLVSVLKDIEKQHRAKEISDDTYHKLKEKYKQEAVITMKQLEDIKSKV